MKRRSFLTFLGLAPVAVVASRLPAPATSLYETTSDYRKMESVSFYNPNGCVGAISASVEMTHYSCYPRPS